MVGFAMASAELWYKEVGARVEGSRDLDRDKVQAPCIVRKPGGGYRLFYTGIGPGKPFDACQGYILSATSEDGLSFAPEPSIRVVPLPAQPHLALRVLAPSIVELPNGGWRMYFEARGTADRPTTICSAVSRDQLAWHIEDGIRFTRPGGVGAPRFRQSPDGSGRLYCFESRYRGGAPGQGDRIGTPVISAITRDGLNFTAETGLRLADRTHVLDSAGITAAEIAPGGPSRLYYSGWQDLPEGQPRPSHPSLNADAVATGQSASFAAASIAADMSGYRSRIFVAHSADGMTWTRDGIVIEGDGYCGADIDAVHAEDMSLIALPDGRLRMYYAACDALGVWRIASAVNAPASIPENP
jgi:hypothetical protein